LALTVFACITTDCQQLSQRHQFNGLLSRTTWVRRHHKGKPFWMLMKHEMIGGSGIS